MFLFLSCSHCVKQGEKGKTMLIQSQPVDPKISKKLGFDDESKKTPESEVIMSQRIGELLDDLFDGKRKISIKTRLGWKWLDIKNVFYDIKYSIRNHFVWFKTINRIRPWEGFDGLISIMITHLHDYVAYEKKYGHSEKEYKEHKIATVKETIELLKRIKEPHDYTDRRNQQVEEKYPKYKSLITEYDNGDTSINGLFVQQGNGWVGKEAGLNPRKGYFEFVDGNFELAASPNQDETNRLLAELEEYEKETSNAYKQAEIDSEEDFKRLLHLLRENLYSWWD